MYILGFQTDFNALQRASDNPLAPVCTLDSSLAYHPAPVNGNIRYSFQPFRGNLTASSSLLNEEVPKRAVVKVIGVIRARRRSCSNPDPQARTVGAAAVWQDTWARTTATSMFVVSASSGYL